MNDPKPTPTPDRTALANPQFASELEKSFAALKQERDQLAEINQQILGGYAGGTRLDMLADWHDHRLKQEGRTAELKDPMSPGALIRGTMGYVAQLERDLAASKKRVEELEQAVIKDLFLMKDILNSIKSK